jgi:hypothetical protein
MKRLFLIILISLGFMSCEPTLCEDCYTIYRSDGSSEWICIEYNCEDYYERF